MADRLVRDILEGRMLLLGKRRGEDFFLSLLRTTSGVQHVTWRQNGTASAFGTEWKLPASITFDSI